MSTPTITLSQLHSEMLRIYAHPLSSTNITNIQHAAGGAVFFETDTSELEEQIAEAKASEARLEAELATAEGERDTLETENEKLTEMHLDFADKESGITPATYREQAEAAAKSRDLYQRAMNEAIAERDALRKRKGVECELFKNQQEVLTFLGSCATGKLKPDEVVELATQLRVKLYAK